VSRVAIAGAAAAGAIAVGSLALGAPLVGLAAAGGAAFLGASLVFGRSSGWGNVLLARTRIDYRREIGDPASNSIVGAVVGWIARNLPEAPVRIVREGTTEVAHLPGPTGPGAMLRLLERPNPYFSGPLQWMATIVDRICMGDAYWIKVRAESGRVTQLWWVPAASMEPRWPENDPTVFIGHYEYTIDGTVYWVRPEDVVHFRNGINPRNTRKGISRLASLSREIFTDEEAANFTASLLRNLGIPGVAIAPTNTVTGRVGLDVEAVKKAWMEKFGGDRRGEPFVSNLPIDVHTFAFNPQEMELRQLRRIPEERVSAVLGVPAGVAQLGAGLDRNTFSNYGEANVAAYTQGVIPDQRILAADLEIQLLPDFADVDADGLDVWFDWMKASAMQTAADAIWRKFESAATKGLVPRSAFKRATGQEVLPGDEVYVAPNNYLFTPVGQELGEAGPVTTPIRPQLQPGSTNGHAAAGVVRCGSCSRLLAELASPPYRFTCSKCKAITEAEGTGAHPSALRVERDEAGRIAAIVAA
jgi:phage portal protein BeeE/phage FluMu protein Com